MEEALLLLSVAKIKTCAVVGHGVHEALPLAGGLLLINGYYGKESPFLRCSCSQVSHDPVNDPRTTHT